MESLPVTLIVKAPNQQIEDQTIKCELSWTIKKLKQHLSEVYPSKPPKHEQKLIYSGQLLNDSVTLKEVLRQYEGQETHTVHLVCTSKYTKNFSQPVLHTTTPSSLSNDMNVANTQSQTEIPTPNIPPDQNIPNGQPNMPWTYVNGTQIDVNQYAVQVMWMQQAYLQYMTQYMQLAANAHAPNIQQITASNNAEPAPQPNPVEQPAPVPERAAAPRDLENPERDWLDVFYMLSRAMVLFSVVYFYSSPIRFIFVLLLGFGLYLYQIGFWRNINNINNNNNNGPPDPVPEEQQAPSRLMVVWTFFATFFASLIPEIPNAI
ncbi:hypothetical protein NQ315_014562 [Exocentrus adspersus]|uniref:Ubiquitin-like domain-containing protein n=1 Tax=Exocentrus adspersus TaxID=1586481 RepID=A0AAV8VLZ5_9CUCU|nr:hypothetical protein NQ315_014562 [Exocentrus adspersus]